MNTVIAFSICGTLIGGSLGYLRWKMTEDFKRPVSYKVTKMNEIQNITEVIYVNGPSFIRTFSGYIQIEEMND